MTDSSRPTPLLYTNPMPALKKRIKSPHVIVAFVILCFLFYFFFSSFSSKEYVRPYSPETALFRNEKLSTEIRITELLSYMTLEEKIGQMTLIEKNSLEDVSDIPGLGLGALISGFGGKPENNTVDGWKKMVSDYIAVSKTNRLGIPLFYGVDAIHGHTNVPGATVFPHAIGLGASGDAELVYAVAQATAQELVATGIEWSFSPNLDLPRDVRWGRTYETFSDDPKLVSRLGVAYVNGLQNVMNTRSSSSIFVLSTPKHYIGLGGMIWGSSSNENFKIDQSITEPNEALLRQEYLPPFKSVVDAGVLSIMVGLNSWGDAKLSASSYLITDVLKGELGFDGFVVSDWYGVYEMAGSDYENAVTAINAGVDMVMLPFDYKPFIKNMLRAVRNGDIEEERIDDSVRRILRAKFTLGLFDDKKSEVSLDVVGSVEHRALAREAVAKSLVLLKDDASVLPIQKNTKLIRIAGSSADNVGKQMGGWTVEWQGIDGNWLPNGTSILAGIRTRVGESAKVEYDAQGNFKEMNQIADLGIAVVGERPYAEGWGDKEYPILSNEDLEAIKKLQAVSKKVVVVIVSGRPLLVTNEISSWDAVVMAWLPGSEGAGVADVLFGDRPFVGKLPLPWPHHSEQLPIAEDGVTSDGTTVLFPRYFGLQ